MELELELVLETKVTIQVKWLQFPATVKWSIQPDVQFLLFTDSLQQKTFEFENIWSWKKQGESYESKPKLVTLWHPVNDDNVYVLQTLGALVPWSRVPWQCDEGFLAPNQNAFHVLSTPGCGTGNPPLLSLSQTELPQQLLLQYFIFIHSFIYTCGYRNAILITNVSIRYPAHGLFFLILHSTVIENDQFSFCTSKGKEGKAHVIHF